MSGPIDEIGPWTEVKVQIVREYATVFQAIVTTQPHFRSVYMDGFAGGGVLVSAAGGQVAGTPAEVTKVVPPFSEYHFIELDPPKAETLRQVVGTVPNVVVYVGDSNKILVETILPTMTYASYRKGLLFLDPYGLHLDWKVVEAAGQTGCVDVLINFPVMDMNRNVLWTDPSGVPEAQVARLTRFFGDERAWKDAVYEQPRGLFGLMPLTKKPGNDAVLKAYQKRLRDVAGFKFVSDALPMSNDTGAVVYHLIGASQAQPGLKVFNSVFKKWRKRGGRI